ncbi:phosphocholine cytidylyltransferase family protein [Candidatus Woesearchaeota archaeon]|nr:phosphocholine cytidylyltransferase family protein [Candidatus Woesearchaeota archaeon]
MKGIILAAGSSKRLRPLTENLPKCMLPVYGKPIIQNTIELFRNNKINDISIIRGWQKEKINFADVNYFENTDFWNNNILYSLMFARKKLEEAIKTNEEVIITYSDIWYNEIVVKELLQDKHDMAAIVDTDWQDYYIGRTEHPITEAENVILDDKKRILKIGKHIFTDNISKERQGEFIGLWKFTPRGTTNFLQHFDRLNNVLKVTEPYQNTKEWQKSYITDIFQEMIDKGENIYAVSIQKNWKEFDTVQDYERIKNEKEFNI